MNTAEYGEVSERFKEPVLKTGDAATHRGFESPPLRHIFAIEKTTAYAAVFFLYEYKTLQRSKDAVARIAKPRYDVSM